MNNTETDKCNDVTMSLSFVCIKREREVGWKGGGLGGAWERAKWRHRSPRRKHNISIS